MPLGVVHPVEQLLQGLGDASLDGRLRGLELERRRVTAEQAMAIARGEADQLHVADGHASMRSYLRATLNCSTTEANRWRRLAKLVDTVPHVGERLRLGFLGVEQAHELARARANPRCGDRLPEVAPLLIAQGEALEFDDFKICVRRWELLADADGADGDRDRADDHRNASAVSFNGGIDLRMSGGDALTAAEIIAVLGEFIEAEFRDDVAARAAEHGPDAPDRPMPRTGAQRRFDAVAEIFRRAAETTAAGSRVATTVNVVVDQRTFAEHLVAHGLAPASALDEVPDRGPAHRRCETAGGAPVHPDDVITAAIWGHVRRVVFDSSGVVIDLGRRRRLFTGAAREAAQLSARRCTRPGCTVPAELADIDHLHDHAHGGATDQVNAHPDCSRHNNQKNGGWRTVRDERTGRVTHLRPDGTALAAAGQPCPLPGLGLRVRRLDWEALFPLDIDTPPPDPLE